tara:strand:- start:213 stop:383 length:171 start_codon:yes stop_codon:yes gene_type:complete
MGKRQTGTGAEAGLLSARFKAALRRAGMALARSGELPLDCAKFRPPFADGPQMSLF